MQLEQDIERCFEGGWSDGLPVVPPYARLVDPMVERMGWRPTEIAGELKDLGIEVKAEQLGAAAIMAGCRLEYAPVLRAVSEALLDPQFNLGGVEVTTGGAAVLVIVSGPIAVRLGFEHEANALGPNARANATVGRFAAMVRYFCGRMGGALEAHGTIGHPGRLSFCIAEHPTTVWPPFHTQFGLPAESSAATLMASEGPNSVNNHYGMTGEAILDTIADCIGQFGTTNYYWRGGGYLVVLPPEHMALVSRAFTREQARRYLYDHSVRATDELIRIGRLPPDPMPRAKVQRGSARSPVAAEHDITFIESGKAGGKFSAVIPGWVANRTTTKQIRDVQAI
ncbi:MAG TPA: hypothetical protein VFK02_35160 [Kofleriaceae bacterium]|nr:hypothetical protein [Kofleriaceae bacterium]